MPWYSIDECIQASWDGTEPSQSLHGRSSPELHRWLCGSPSSSADAGPRIFKEFIMSLAPMYEWLNSTSLSQFLQSSTYVFPVTEVFHLIGLTVLLGAAMVVSLRLLGFGLTQPVSEIYRGIWKWTWFGLI